MTEEEKLKRDIETLRDSIRSNWADLAHLHLTTEERQGIRTDINSCVDELKDLLSRLDKIDA